MMDIFFADPTEIPLPPDEVRILDLNIDPYPDGRRIRVFVEITPFQKKPSGDIAVVDSTGRQVAATSFIEAITPKIEMTLHLRSFDDNGQYSLKVTLYYTQEIEDEQTDAGALVRPEQKFIHQKELPFSLS